MADITPNPTAEQIVSEALGPYGLIGRARDRAARNAVEQLRAHGLLSVGAPSDGDCRGYCEHGHAPCAKPVGDFMCTRAAKHDGVCVACSEDVHDLTAALTADGVAPQEPQALDPEKVAELIEQVRDRSRKERDVAKESLGQFVARALCEAYTEGKLT